MSVRPYPVSVAEQRTTILIVDDEENILSLMAETLRLVGFATETAARGADAVSKIRSEKIDLVLLDINMPVMDGFECAQKIKDFYRDGNSFF